MLRPELPFAAGVCVVIGEIIALGNVPSLSILLLGFAWGFFLSSPAMVLNDYFDIEVDKINAPKRPLPSGMVSPFSAVVLTAVLTLVGLLVSWFIGLSAVALYLAFWLIGLVYNWKLKEAGLFGNMMVSSSVAITIILGGMAVGQPWHPTVWLLGLMFFLFNLAEEIAADSMDMEGDRKRNTKSVPILIGKTKAIRISALLFALVIVLSFLPIMWGLLGTNYLVIISLTDTMIVLFGFKLIRCRSTEDGRAAIRGLYLSALFGAIAMIVSSIVFR